MQPDKLFLQAALGLLQSNPDEHQRVVWARKKAKAKEKFFHLYFSNVNSHLIFIIPIWKVANKKSLF